MSAAPTTKPMVRCAIYTRKSTEEGLDQEFNSLDAQREAGEAYIASQRHEGWVLLKQRYDDGGISGATLERPALQRLLDDCRAGKIDCIVVYKVDRLSRSLLDFAQLVETFNAANVVFVSVTQHFNTNDSMGRLTLNILLSFAQFEREVIAERIRDKMSASRKKGKWVGGRPPFGYDVDYRAKKLVVNEVEARWVRWIFDRFIQTRSTTVVIRELAEQGITTKSWTTKNGSDIMGKPWDRGAIYKALANRTYLGQVDYKGSIYDGEHAALIDQRTWDEAHAILAEAPQARANRDRVVSNRAAANPAFLVGLVRCAHCGGAMSPSFTKGKNGAYYRYYRCQAAQKKGADLCPVGSVPAGELEKEVLSHLRRVFQAPEVLTATSRAVKAASAEGGLPVDHQAVVDALRKVDAVWDELYPGEQTRIVSLLVDHIQVGLERVSMAIRAKGVEHLLGDGAPRPGDNGLSEVVLPVECRRRCGRTRLLAPASDSQEPVADPNERNEVTEALARAFVWQEELESGVASSITALAQRQNVDESYVRRQIELMNIAPRLLEGHLIGSGGSLRNLLKAKVNRLWAEGTTA